MHECPRCGESCDCSGDIDDASVMKEDWVFTHCSCDCEHMRDDDDWDEHEDYGDDEVFGYECCGCRRSQGNAGPCNICGNPTDPMYF
jgi:hypothetical protein